MPIILSKQKKQFFGELIDKETVVKMVNAYRKKHESDCNALWYSHFAVLEVLELLQANGIISPETFEVIINNHPEIDKKKAGLKIYLGTHISVDDSPRRDSKYINHDTTIICNTALTQDDSGVSQWVDLLGDDKDSIIYFGLDKTSICRPDCNETFDQNRIISI